jgi:RNA polymerase sigma-70 factor (ECF subfamily)
MGAPARGVDHVGGGPEPEPLVTLAFAAGSRAPGAFDELVQHVSKRILAVARQMLRDPGLAEEALQESLVRIYRFLPTYSGGSFLAWYLTLTNRVCVDLLRREQRQAPLRAVDPPAEFDPTEASDVRAVVEQALREVPPDLRSTFVLRQQGLSYADIAAVLGVPVGTVRSRLFEARRLLRQRLGVVFDRREA